MNNLTDFDSEALMGHFNEDDIVDQTIEQIKKDFLSADVELHFSREDLGSEVYAGLMAHVSPVIKNLFTTNQSACMTILYRVDIPEDKLISGKGLSTMSYPEYLCDMIIRRELQKVVMRKLGH